MIAARIRVNSGKPHAGSFTVIGVCGLVMIACGTEMTTPPTIDGPGPIPDKTGRVSLLIGVSSQTFDTANFSDGTTVLNQRIDGPCVITISKTPSSVPKVSAGNVTITHGGTVLTLMHDADHQYGSFREGRQYASGDPISINASGDTVPAFSQSITFPEPILVTDPAPGGSLFNKSGFDVSWTGTGPVLVKAQQRAVSIRCRYDGVSSATIPASALSDFVTGPTAPQILSEISRAALRTFDAGSFRIEIEANDVGFSQVEFVP